MQSVLVIEDNADMRDALQRFLERHDFLVVAVESSEDGIDMVDEQDFDLALIDINLPGKSGFSMIEYIRSEGKNMPLIAMTARDGLNDKLTGFDLGLTDYITKPFNLEELLARMQAHLRSRSSASPKQTIHTPTFSINPETWEFLKDSKLVELTKTEFRLMHILMQHNHTVVKTNDVIEYVWGDGPDSLNPPVRIHIANLRKKIGDESFSTIKTIPGVGYKLNDHEPERIAHES